jgi:TRAP transporter TAXI family solute receptor
MKKKKISLIVVIGLALILAVLPLLAACPGPAPTTPSEERPQNVQLTMCGFIAGTSMQMRADAIAEAIRVEYPDWKVTSVAPGSEAQLISKRIAGEADYFFTPYPRLLEVEVQAPLHPEIDYEKVTAYSLVMPTSPRYVHFFATGKTGLTSIRDIVDKRYPFKAGTGAGASKLLFSKILEYYGASLAEAEGWGAKHESVVMATQEGAEALQSGRLDIAFGWSGMPSPPYMGVNFDLKLLPVDDPGLVEMLSVFGHYEATIPADTYPFLTEDVPTVAETEILAVRPDMPEDVVYYTVKALFNHTDILVAAHSGFKSQLNAEAVAAAVAISQTTGIPFHPGALKFYREMGWIE